MKKLKELLSKCQGSVSINVNQHKAYYQSVEHYIKEQVLSNSNLINEIGLDVHEEMKKTNTVIEIDAYPATPIGSYTVIHYDIDKAVDIMLSHINYK